MRSYGGRRALVISGIRSRDATRWYVCQWAGTPALVKITPDLRVGEIDDPAASMVTDALDGEASRVDMSTVARSAGRHVPGETELWIFLLGDMIIFAVFFTVWTVGNWRQPELFDVGRAHANKAFGLANTLALITSSWFVASGVVRARRGEFIRATRCFVVAVFLGAVFVINKVFEYREKVHAGADISGNRFDMYYFVFTGIHLLHVIVGMLLLALMIRRVRGAGSESAAIPFIEGAGAYWHLVDVFWIVLFLLIYIV